MCIDIDTTWPAKLIEINEKPALETKEEAQVVEEPIKVQLIFVGHQHSSKITLPKEYSRMN